jgi:hypothetical protein
MPRYIYDKDYYGPTDRSNTSVGLENAFRSADNVTKSSGPPQRRDSLCGRYDGMGIAVGLDAAASYQSTPSCPSSSRDSNSEAKPKLWQHNDAKTCNRSQHRRPPPTYTVRPASVVYTKKFDALGNSEARVIFTGSNGSALDQEQKMKDMVRWVKMMCKEVHVRRRESKDGAVGLRT